MLRVAFPLSPAARPPPAGAETNKRSDRLARGAAVEIAREPDPDFEQCHSILSRSFPTGYARSARYLEWLYASSCGMPALVVAARYEGYRIGQMVFLPHPVDCGGVERVFGFTADFAVLPQFRSGPLLIKLTREALEVARREGLDGIYGLPNAASLPVVSRFLKGQQVGRLQVRIGLSLPLSPLLARSAHVESRDVASMSDAQILDLLAPHTQSRQNERIWTAQRLLARLRSPLTQFALHEAGEGLGISAASTTHGLRVTMLCAFLPATGERLSWGAMRALTNAACRFHGSRVFCYAGINAHVARLPGVPVPLQFYPSPLILLARGMAPGAGFSPQRYELIDTDVV
jgi:predicted N-acetyltransferase YhbS